MIFVAHPVHYPNPITLSDVELLLGRLQSRNDVKRIQAQKVLAKIGKAVVPELLLLLTDRREYVRWEASRTLARIKDPLAADPLAALLLDESVDVRWSAAAALINLELHAIDPVLVILEEHFDSFFVRESAYHIFHALKVNGILPAEIISVVTHLEGSFSSESISREARLALDQWRQNALYFPQRHKAHDQKEYFPRRRMDVP